MATVRPLVSLIVGLLSLLTVAPSRGIAQSVGSPNLASSIVAQSSPALGVWTLDLQLTNNGSAVAQNIVLNTVQLRTLSGSGAVAYDTRLSPGLPLAVGDLAPGSSAVVRLDFDAPATVLRFSVTENGTLLDASGTSFNVSQAQAVFSTSGLISVQPNTGQQGQQNMPVTITGRYSHFTQGVTTADFGAGVTVQSLAVNSLTSATAVLNIDPAAILGPRTVTLTTGAESLKLNNGFTVTAGTPVLTTVNPNTGQQGQQSENVSLTGQFTHWVQGTTTASFGTGITVASLTVNSATSATAVLNIDPAAAVGSRNVTVSTGAEVVALNNGFTVTAGTPVLTTVNPNTGQQGQQGESVSLAGQFTHWAQGTSIASFGAGITAASLTVNSATSATAVLNIDPAAAVGSRNVTVSTGAEVVALNNGFTVTAGTPVLTTVNPNSGQQGQQSESVNLIGQFAHWTQGTTTASFGAGITAASLTVNSATSATAVLNIDPAAAVGSRNVTVSTGAEVVALNNGFTVTASTPVLTTVTPNTGLQGQQSESVSLTGQFTHWTQGTTTASFGAGITVATLTINSATGAIAVLNIDPAAAVGPRNVTLTTGAEVVTLNNGFTVAAPNSISFTVQPGSVRLGQHFAPAVQVTLLDVNGQVLTAANGPITIALKTSVQGAVLSGTLTQNAVNGVATFTDLSVSRTGKADTLIASSDGLTATSAPFDVVMSSAQAGACVPVSSQSLLVQGPNVSAYIPNGAWGNPTKNVQLVPIEGTGARATIQTPNPVNSCASNWDTGQTVCTANNTDVYLMQGPTLTNTLTSGSTGGVGFPFLSGGSCQNCGVAMNAASNQAVIAMGLLTGPGIQILDLNTNTFAPPISTNGLGISEAILVDPNLNMVLSAPETNQYALVDLNAKTVFDFDISKIVGNSFADSVAEDCVTGIALAAQEDSVPTQIFFTDLTQATFDTATSTWTAPAQSQSFPEFLNITTAEGISVASSAHLGLVVGEFGYSGFGVIQLPSTSGSGTPAAVDYVAVRMPADPSGDRFAIQGDPHTVSTYMSPNDGKAYGVVPSASGSNLDSYVAIIDLQGILNAPRSSAHTLASSVDLAGTGLVRFVPIGSFPAQMAFVSQPAGGVAGQAIQVQVAIENAQGQVDSNNTFPVTLSLAGSGTRISSVLPVNGIATFNVFLSQAGTYSLTASTSQLGTITSNPFTVGAAAAANLSFVTQPSNIVAGQPLPTIQVAWLDQFGNPTASTLPITLALITNAAGATLSGTTTVTVMPVNGVATFTGLTVDRTSTVALVASATGAAGLTQALSKFFEVTSGPATQLAFLIQPTTEATGPGLGMTVQVGVEDTFGNIVTNANNTVTLALGANPTGATLFPAGTRQPSSGVVLYTGVQINFAGVGYTLVASSPGLASATSIPFNVSGAGPPATLTPGSILQGTTVSVTITTQNTHFQQGMTAASFGPGLMVGSGPSGGFGPVTVTSATTAVAQVSAAATAAPGLRTVVLQTGTEQDTFFDAFTVEGTPFLTSISPASGTPGQTLSVTIQGEFTNFVQGTTQANFGPGISVGGGAQGAFGPVTVTAPGTAVAQVTIDSGAAVGLRIPITVKTGAEQASLTAVGFLVLGTVTGPAPVVNFTSLTEGMEITAPTSVTGTITSPNLSAWTLDFAAAGSNSFTPIAAGTSPAVSGTLDPTLLLNGMITVRLTAVDQSGQTTSATVNVVVARKLKVGNFTLSFVDVNIPVAGIPIQIVRTYDSRDKSAEDFGVGWSLAVKSVQVNPSGILGKNWTGTSTGGLIPTYCVKAGQNYVVSVRLQDGTLYQFQPVPTTPCAQILPPQTVDLTFVPIGSTPPNAQLSQPNSASLFISGQFPGPLQLLDLSTGAAYGLSGDADQWILTMPTGQSVQVSATFGVQAITDRNGNSLAIGPNGITSSNGPAVKFTRDGQNRITAITDPNFNSIQYQYTGTGDLAAVVDQRNNVSKFSYDSNHDLISLTDPTGAQPVRNVYDDSGRLIQQIDAFGHVETFAHNLAANTETFTDFLGNTTTYVYDNHGNVVQETDALGNTTSRTFDANDNLLSETNALGNTTSYTYDANDNRLSVTDPLGGTTTFTYNALNEALVTTDPNGNITRSNYDASGNLASVTNALGSTATNTFTNNGQLATITDHLGNTTGFGYDSKGNLLSSTDALGNVVSYNYDANGNRTSQTVVRTTATGKQTLSTKYKYDEQNRIIQTTTPDGSITQTIFNAIGQPSTTIDELGRQTSYSYDAAGRLTTTAYPDGTSITNTFDAVGNRVTVTDQSGATTAYTYDPLHRLVATTDALGGVVSSVYDAAGEKLSSTDTSGNVTRYGYDKAGRRTTITDALGEASQIAFDAAGRPTSAKDPAGHVTSFQYDALGHRTQIKHPDGTAETTAYDAGGNIVTRTDAAGKTTEFGYDGLRRLVSVIDALGDTTSYGYDELGDRVSITDANGHLTLFQYDQLGRRNSRTLPGGQSEAFAYDSAGELTSHTDFNGRTTTYTYDSAGRMLLKTPDPSFNAPTVSYAYTPSGRRASMVDVTGTTTYGYDRLDRLILKQSPEGSITYGYDPAGHLITLQAGTSGVTYAYDALNRLASVNDSVSGTTAYRYDVLGNLLTASYPNGAAHSYLYDSLNRLTSLAVSTNGSPGASYSYALDAAGHRLSVAELSGRTVNYSYDAIYRLTSERVTGAVKGPNGTVGYTYDAVGNRTQANSTLPGVASGSFNYDPDNRLSRDVYDSAGNTVSLGGLTNSYDFENHLIQRGSVSIVYDGDGNRVSETVGGITTKYLIDDLSPTGFPQVIAESSSDGSTRWFVYGAERISQRQFIPSSNSTVTSFYLYDGHGSVRALADGTGTITDSYDYDAFGNLINRTGTTVNNFLFAGEQFDPALGIYYNRARYYDEGSGRFWTMDALEGTASDPASLHKYLYTRGNPVNRVDPSGNQDIAEEMVAVEVQGILTNAAVGGALGCAQGALTPGSSCLEGAVSGAIGGAFLGALGPVVGTVGKILLGFATSGLAGYEAYEACQQKNYALCALDALLSVGGAFLTARSVPESAPAPPTPGGAARLAPGPLPVDLQSRVDMVDNPTGCKTNCSLTADGLNDVLGGGGPVRVGATGPTSFQNINPKYNTGWIQTTTFSRIASILASRGPGARGIVVGMYASPDPNLGFDSHAFNVVNWRGSIYAVDAQAGGKADVTLFSFFEFWADDGSDGN